MSILREIVQWNNIRGLIDKGYNHSNERSFILEEVIETSTPIESKTANKIARIIGTVISWIPGKTTPEQKVDGYCDMIVFATGAIAKLGYDPDKSMSEVMKELADRTGEMVNGKFVKDVKENPYKADFSVCKYED